MKRMLIDKVVADPDIVLGVFYCPEDYRDEC